MNNSYVKLLNDAASLSSLSNGQEQLSANKPDFVTANKLQFETTVHMDSGIRRAG